MKVDKHPELLGSSHEMTDINQEVFWHLTFLLQKQLKEKNDKKPVSKIDTSTDERMIELKRG